MATRSTRPGMGAIPYPGGVTFRVWAPFAGSVSAAGAFNGGSPTASPLAPEGDGHWSADVPGAAVGHDYRFVIDGGRWRIDPRARQVTHSSGVGIVADPEFDWRSNDFAMPPWDELVIYQMHPGTFPDRPVGPDQEFDAIIGDLDYLVELGVNAIQLLPTGEFFGDLSWGYNPANIFAVESSYGGPKGLKRLVDAAHGKGLAVFLDLVYNHLGPQDLGASVWQFDGWFRTHDGDEMGGIYFYNDWRARTPWGHKNRPDYGRPEVRSFLRDNALMWLEEYRVDGLRFDMSCYIRNVDARDDVPPDDPTNLDGWGWNLLRWISDEIDAHEPWKITLAEDMRRNHAVTRPTSEGGAGIDSQWDDLFVHTVRAALATPRDEDRDLGAVQGAVEHRYGGDPFRRVVYTESHDEVATKNGKRRLTEDIHPGQADSWYAKKRSTLGAALVMTSPGIPMIFQGQEILEWLPFDDDHYMDWDKYDEGRFRGIYHLYRDLIRLRRNWSDRTRGLRGRHVNVFHRNDRDKVLAFHRWQDGGPGDDVVVVANFGDRGYQGYTIGLPRPGPWHVRFNSDWQGYDGAFGDFPSDGTTAEPGGRDGLPCRADVGVGPYSAIILSQ
ncbi:alpha-amylase family glycosyl hydrolase [Tautonia plasticadhaerens]|uniref:1,4-alpha-glucan branching enzyme n=1 Tax=Tautonia plasticadhaerens TaxID=2527974 RepID=A0A518H1K2_9BACT|nr:alpha-amylase family glycosyl hydrolase [Tautonia plasticadhaerens]QDV34718.1 1,4-alpha-glucan branching enzyme GlgB [Tautonia plasticadhaerens]